MSWFPTFLSILGLLYSGSCTQFPAEKFRCSPWELGNHASYAFGGCGNARANPRKPALNHLRQYDKIWSYGNKWLVWLVLLCFVWWNRHWSLGYPWIGYYFTLLLQIDGCSESVTSFSIKDADAVNLRLAMHPAVAAVLTHGLLDYLSSMNFPVPASYFWHLKVECSYDLMVILIISFEIRLLKLPCNSMFCRYQGPASSHQRLGNTEGLP